MELWLRSEYSERPKSGWPITGNIQYSDIFVSGYQSMAAILFLPFDSRTGYQTIVRMLTYIGFNINVRLSNHRPVVQIQFSLKWTI
jgi:hypothetical protein